MITIYGKDNCPYCDNAIKISEIRGVEHEVKKLDKDFNVDEFLAMSDGKHRTFPLIVDTADETSEPKIIGGFDQYKEWLVGGK